MQDSLSRADPNVSKRQLRLPPSYVAGLAYVLLAATSFYTLIARFTVAIPGEYGRHPDFAVFYWNAWWFQHAAFDLGRDPFFTNYIFYPHTINLAYHTFAPILNLLSLPFYATLGPTVAINSWIVGSLVFSGVATFAFLRHHEVSAGPAFLGGALFMFTSANMSRISMAHLSMIPIGWLPLGLLAWDWLVETRTVKSGIVLGAMLYGAVMTDLQIGMWLALLLVPYAVVRLMRTDAHARRRLVPPAALAGVVCIALLLVAPLPQLYAGRDTAFPQVSMKEVRARSLQVGDLVALPGRVVYDERTTLGVLLPALIAVSLVRGKRIPGRWFWLTMGIAFLVVSMGPVLEPMNIPLPYQLFHSFAGGQYRVPARFILPAVFALITFVALSSQPDYQRLPRRAQMVCVASMIVLLALENRWYEPFPVFSMPDYRIYHEIGSDPDEYLVLEVPVGMNSAIADPFGDGPELQYYSIVHHKRLLNGNVSRAPAGITGAYRRWPLITALAKEGPIPDLESAQSEFRKLSREWDIRYVIVHREMLPVDLATWATAFFNTQPDWCLVDEEGSLLAYRRVDIGSCPSAALLSQPPDGVIDLGDERDDRFRGPGWYPGENVGGPQARWTGEVAVLRVYLLRQDYSVTMRAASFATPQTLTVYADGNPVASVSIDEGWDEYVFSLPASAVPPGGLVTLTFAHARAESAYDRSQGQSEDRRPLAVAYDSIVFAPEPIRP